MGSRTATTRYPRSRSACAILREVWLFPQPVRTAQTLMTGLRAAFAAIARKARIPGFALGGIKTERIEEAAKAGAKGVAVSGAIFLSEDVESAAKKCAEAAERFFGKGKG